MEYTWDKYSVYIINCIYVWYILDCRLSIVHINSIYVKSLKNQYIITAVIA